MNDTVITRDFDPELDRPFIFMSWRRSLWHAIGGSDERSTESTMFYTKTSREIEKIIKDAKIKVACAKDDPSFIYGYSVIENGTLSWVYVKIDYRRNGIAKLLSKEAVEVGEPKTKLGRIFCEKIKRYIYKDSTQNNSTERNMDPMPICEPTLPSGAQNER